MIRALLLIAAGLLTIGADRPASVDYRLGVTPQTGGPPIVVVEMRLRGDADGATLIALPQASVSEPAVSGAAVTAPDDGHRLLRHKPGARLAFRYRVGAPGDKASALAATGRTIFAIPEGRAAQVATLRWNRTPREWRVLSDLDPGLSARAPTVADLDGAVLLAGPDLRVAERAIPGGVLRAAVFGDEAAAARLADNTAPLVSAQRAFWRDGHGPFLVATGFSRISGSPTNLTLPADILARSDPSDPIAQALTRSWIPQRLGGPAANGGGVMEGLAGLYADRVRVRAGLIPLPAAVSTLAMADTRRDGSSRGMILALKWDEDIRRKSAGKLDLDDVVLRMADHYRRFPPGQGPDVVTGLVSAAWVTAGLDLRPDLARYAGGAVAIPLPETLFDGCLDARVTVAPGFDPGFDASGSFAAKAVRGVRRGGPAWNSGLRNGMALERWTFTAGDMTREIELHVRAPGKRLSPRTIRYWPYGDVDVETRRLQIAVGLTEATTAACARKIGGL